MTEYLRGLPFSSWMLEGVAFVVDEGDLDAAIAAVIFVVGGAVGEDVLVADGVVDLVEDVGECTLKERVEVEAAGHLGEGAELVFGLEIVEALDADGRYSLVSLRSRMRGAKRKPKFHLRWK